MRPLQSLSPHSSALASRPGLRLLLTLAGNFAFLGSFVGFIIRERADGGLPTGQGYRCRSEGKTSAETPEQRRPARHETLPPLRHATNQQKAASHDSTMTLNRRVT